VKICIKKNFQVKPILSIFHRWKIKILKNEVAPIKVRKKLL
jgi:hypothetical protein